MPDDKKKMLDEENSLSSALLEIIDTASEARSALKAFYELYAITRDRDTYLNPETVATAAYALYDKALILLLDIEKEAEKLRAAVA